VSLARLAPESARSFRRRWRKIRIWQARTRRHRGPRARGHRNARKAAADPQPNVAAAAMTTNVSPSGPVVESRRPPVGGRPELWAPELPAALPQVLATLQRLTRTGRATVRDPRMELLDRIREAGTPAMAEQLRGLLADRDPAVSARAAEIISQKTGTTVAPKTTFYVPDRLPTAQTLNALQGARARVTMKGLGTFTLN
jgi:hypothetical protein